LHIWLSDQQLAFVHCASDRQWQWGVWDALTREVTYYQPPSVLDRAALRPLGWLQNPPRLVLCSNFPSPPNPEVVLLDIHSHHVERVGIDQGHHCALLFHECERVLCVPDRRTSDAAPYLADLASGKALDFSGRMLRTPPSACLSAQPRLNR